MTGSAKGPRYRLWRLLRCRWTAADVRAVGERVLWSEWKCVRLAGHSGHCRSAVLTLPGRTMLGRHAPYWRPPTERLGLPARARSLPDW